MQLRESFIATVKCDPIVHKDRKCLGLVICAKCFYSCWGSLPRARYIRAWLCKAAILTALVSSLDVNKVWSVLGWKGKMVPVIKPLAWECGVSHRLPV